MQSSKPKQEVFQPNGLINGEKDRKSFEFCCELLIIGNNSKYFGRLNKWEIRSENHPANPRHSFLNSDHAWRSKHPDDDRALRYLRSLGALRVSTR